MRKIILSIFVISFTMSCSDFLEVEPDRQVSINEQLSTEQGLEQVVNGLYRDVEALLSSKVHLYGDALSGNTTFSPTTTNRTVSIRPEIEMVYNFADIAVQSDFDSFYEDCYAVINQVNLLIERKGSFTYLSNERLGQLEAELLVIRALMHYELSLLYSQNYGFTATASHPGVVYNTTTLRVGIDFPARESAATVYTLLKNDLDRSLELFTNNSFLTEGTSLSVFNSINTQALYARIALQMNDWPLAASLADDVIRTSGLQLTPNASYLAQWSLPAPLSETLLSFTEPRDAEGTVGSSISAYYLYSSPTVYGSYVATGDLINSYESSDIRRNLFSLQTIPTNIGGTLQDRDYFFSTKYQRDSGTLFMRLSEMYLIQAEALQRETPGNTTALNRLNDIRERAGLTRLGNITLDDILLERRREFPFENMYFYDLARYKKDVVRNLGCISTVCNLTYPSNFFVLPIPQPSVFSNPNMTQNEGY